MPTTPLAFALQPFIRSASRRTSRGRGASRIRQARRACESPRRSRRACTLMVVSIPADTRLLALEDVATQLRVDSVRATTAAGSGHPTSCASGADLVAAIFFDVMRFDPLAPRDPACDRFVLSKGHAAPLLYAAWAAAGALDRKDLVQLRQIDSDLEGHPTPRLPFVDVATGSLGQGLGVGVGLALGARMLGT